MPVSGNNWEKIRQGIKDVQILIEQKRYNLSMVKCRQTLEYMVHDLCDKALITTQNTNQDMASLIDELYSGRWISKTTCEHYHKIRMLGNKAVHDGNENAYDANQAYHLLSHEIVTFSKDYMNDGRRSSQQPPVQQRSGAQPSRSSGMPRSSAGNGNSGASRSRRRSNQSGFPFTSTDLLRILIIVFAIILIFGVARMFRSDDSETQESTSAATTNANESSSADEPTQTPEETTGVAAETMPDTTPAPVYKTTTHLNVRPEPSTNSTRLGVLDPDTVVEYLGDYDESWAIINYNGTQAYVSKQYLTHD